MKKRILSLCILLCLCLSLCGCQYLDDLRAVQGKLTQDGTIQLQDGSEYQRLYQTCEELSPIFSRAITYHIAQEEDVPLLLTPIVCGSAYMSEDGLFLRAYVDDTTGPTLYCRTDIYDSVVDRIKNGFQPEVYCYEYYDHKSGKYLIYELTQEQVEALELVYTTQEPYRLPAAAALTYDHYADLYHATSDHLFQRDCMDICMSEDEYYVVVGSRTLYPVPEELTSVFSEIMRKEVHDGYY